MALTQTQVSQLYVTLFGRVSEGAGNKFWQNSQDIATAATNMLATEAAKEYFGSALTSDEAFIKHIYKNTLNKTEVEDPEGINFWVKALKSGVSRGTVVAELIKAAQDPKNKGASQDLFNNKVALSDYTAGKVEGKGLKAKDLAPFKSVLNKITSNPNSVEAAKPAVDALAGISTDTSVDWHSNPEHPGKAYELTTNTDNATANVFNAPMKHNPGGTDRIMTLQSSDKLTGDYSRHDNTLNVEFGQANADEGDPTSRTPTLTNIQNINIEVTGTVNTLDLRDSNDVEKINIHRITKEAGNKFNVESIGQKLVGMRLANVAKKDIDVKFEHKKGVLSGFEDKSNVFLENVEAKSLSITSDKNTEGYENLNLISKQGVSLNKFEANQLRELTIKGSGELKIADVELNDGANPQFNKVNDGGIKTPGTRGFTKLDASGYTGSLTLDITDIVKEASDPFDSGKKLDTDIIGSKLGDTFYLRGGVGSRTNIDGGAGEDKLVLVSGSIGTGKRADGVTDSKITNIENLEMRAQSGDLSADFDRFDESLKRVLVRTEQMDAAATFTLSNISEKFSKEGVIDIEHSAGNKDETTNYNTIIKATLKNAKGDKDSLTFRVLDANNKDNSFEFEIGAKGVENITVKDEDSEDNEMKLTNAADHTGKVTLTGGTAGKYFAVASDIVAKELDASGQKSNLRLTVKDQKDKKGENVGQDIKLGSGDDILTFKELDGLDKNDKITDAGGNDTLRALFSKNSALNLKGIEGVHIAAKNNVELDISNSDITKVVIMSKEAVEQTDNVDSLGKGVKGMGSTDVDASKIITFKTAKIDTLNFAGDLDNNDDNANDEKTTQNFNGVTIEKNESKDLNVNINSSLDYVAKGAEKYNVEQITVLHGTENITVNVANESNDPTKDVKTTIKNIYAKDLKTLKLNATRDLDVGTVTANDANNGMTLVDASNVLGNFTANVVGLGDGAKVKMADGNNKFSALGSAGKLINITAGNGNNEITGSAQSDFITAGNGDNKINGDRGDNVMTVGDGNDTVTAKDGNDTVVLGKGIDEFKDNIGTGLDAVKATNTVTKEHGVANVKIDSKGDTMDPGHTDDDVDQIIAVGKGSTLKMQWLGKDLVKEGTLLDGAQAEYTTAATDTLQGNDKNNFWVINHGSNTKNSITVNGGVGNDVAIVSKDGADANAALTFNGGEGNDAAVGGKQSDFFQGGEGADVYAMQNSSTPDGKTDTVKISDGESVAGNHDIVYGFKTGQSTLLTEGNKAGVAGNDSLDLDYAANLTNIATGGDKEVSGYGKIAKYSVDNKGLVTFKDKDGNTVGINKKNLDKALDILAKEYNNTNKTLAFNYDKDGNDATTNDKSTFVFQDGVKDTVVELAGVTANGVQDTTGADADSITVG